MLINSRLRWKYIKNDYVILIYVYIVAIQIMKYHFALHRKFESVKNAVLHL